MLDYMRPRLSISSSQRRGGGRSWKKEREKGRKEKSPSDFVSSAHFSFTLISFCVKPASIRASPSSAGFYWVLSCDKRWYCPPHRNWVTMTVPWWPPPLPMLLNVSHMLPSMLPSLLSPSLLVFVPPPGLPYQAACSPAVNSSPQPQPSLVHWVITVTSYWGTHH